MIKERSLNFITKIILIVLVILLMVKNNSWINIMLCQGLALVLITLNAKIKLTIQSVVLVGVLYGINYAFSAMPYELDSLWNVIYIPLQIFVLMLLYLLLAVATTRIEDLHTTMQFLRLPSSLILVILVKIRFWQTLRSELKNIRAIMYMRGFERSLFNDAEQVYSPLLADGVKTNDELTVCAYLRGLGAYRNTTALRKLKFSFLDVFSVIVLLVLLFEFWSVII